MTRQHLLLRQMMIEKKVMKSIHTEKKAITTFILNGCDTQKYGKNERKTVRRKRWTIKAIWDTQRSNSTLPWLRRLRRKRTKKGGEEEKPRIMRYFTSSAC